MKQIKQYLRQCRAEMKEIQILTVRMETLRLSLLPSGIRYKEIDIQTSGGGDPMYETMPEIIDLENILKVRVRQLLEKQTKAYEMINQLEDSKQRQLMILYYLDTRLLSWEDVAKNMNYSVDHIYRLHGIALNNLMLKAKTTVNES